MRVAVQPVRSHDGPGKRVELLAAESVQATSTSSAASIYIIQPVDKLPTINISRTLAGVIAGRKRAQLADQRAVRLASRYHALWYAMGIAFSGAWIGLWVNETSAVRSMVTSLTVVLMGPILWIHAAALCWDMLVLLVHTFEFWFLILITIIDTIIWSSMLDDVRIVASLVGSASYMLTVFLDANLHMRVLVLRLFVSGAFSLLALVALVNLHLASSVVDVSFALWGSKTKTIDVMNSGIFTIGFFMITRVFRHRKVVFSWRREEPDADRAAAMVQCDIYFPVCRLVLYEEWNRQRLTITSPRVGRRFAETTQLELVEQDQLRIVDARDTIARLRCCRIGFNHTVLSRLAPVLPWIVNAIGIAGAGLEIFLCGQEIVDAHNGIEKLRPSANGHLAAYISTGVFVLTHAVYFQRDLFRRICYEIDAWFVSCLISSVAVGVCDVFSWDKRSLLVATAWMWTHWMLFLDALPPVVRNRLVLSRRFILFVSLMLLAFPLWLAYMILFAPTAATNRNRTIFHRQVGQVDVRMEMQSFLLSRLFTLWVWMGRFFWREVLRPRDSFKLIKYRVQFPTR